MPYANGRLPQSALTEVQPGAYLAKPTARAWKRLVQDAKTKLHRSIAVVGGAGAYRSYAVQDAMHDASVSHDRAAKVRWNLNPNSSVALAAAGYSTHGLGTRVDIAGTAIDGPFLALAARHGFTREFGAKDPNHFVHDGKTSTGIVKAAVTPKPTPKPRRIEVEIRPDDTLSAIAGRYRTDVPTLLELNAWIHDRNHIPAGRKIRVA